MLVDPRIFGGTSPTVWGEQTETPVGGGLLGNPYLQMGLGILANNTGNYGQLGPALGRGMQQGLQQVQASRQFDQQSKLYQLRLAAEQREQEEAERKQKAIEAFNTKYPDMAGLADLSPTAAVKAAYPTLNTADPYFSPIPTEQGLAYFDHRTGKLELINGQSGAPVVKSSDSPLVRGAVKGAEAQATANWKPTDMLDGQILTEAQLAQQARGGMPAPGMPPVMPPQSGLPSNNFNTPYPVTMGAPGTTVTDRMEGTVTDNLGVGNPARPNVGGGIRVPTEAQKAAAKTAAEEQAKFNSPEAATKRAKAQEFKQTMGNVVLDKIDDVVKRVDSFSAGFGGSVLDAVPGTDAYDLKADLDTIKANFGFDRLQAMRDLSPTGGALGQVAVQELSMLQASIANLDNAQSPSQLKANLAKAKKHYENWMKTLDADPNKKQLIPSGKAGGNVNQPRKPMKGQKVDGYKFMGGDPADPANWKKL